MEGVTCVDAAERHDDSDQCGGIFRDNGVDSRILAVSQSGPERFVAFLLPERTQANPEADAFENECAAENNVIPFGVLKRCRMQNVQNALVSRNPATYTKDEYGNDQAPEVQFFPVSERMLRICGSFLPLHAHQQKQLVTSIDRRMDTFGHHCGTAGDGSPCELGHRDESVAGEGSIHRRFRF